MAKVDRNAITPEYLAAVISYNPETGELHWKHRADRDDQWNARCAGKRAFTSVQSRGYHSGGVDGHTFIAHRVAWAIYYGKWPQNQIDHLDGNKRNNRIANLRDASVVENNRNMPVSKRNATGVLGVVWLPQRRVWRAEIMVDRKMVRLGCFANKEDAVSARKDAEGKFGFHRNHGRL
jgi:hypothetical protein